MKQWLAFKSQINDFQLNAECWRWTEDLKLFWLCIESFALQLLKFFLQVNRISDNNVLTKRDWFIMNLIRLIIEFSFHAYILTRLNYLSWIFWLDLILISSQNSIWVFDLTHQAIENNIKCQDLLFLNLLYHYIWKSFMQQTNLFLFSLFALSCCIINKIYCVMSDSDKTYELSRSSIEKEFNFLIIHSSTFSSLHSNEFAS